MPMELRDAGSAGNNCMLLSILAAAGLPPDAKRLRSRIASAIDAMSGTEREAFLRDVAEPAQAVDDPTAVLGPTYHSDFGEWSDRVRNGSTMLGAAELHVLKRLLKSEGIDIEEISLRSLSNVKTATAWARKQRAAYRGDGRLVLIVTDGTHYNWVSNEPAVPQGPVSRLPLEPYRGGGVSKPVRKRHKGMLIVRDRPWSIADAVVASFSLSPMTWIALTALLASIWMHRY